MRKSMGWTDEPAETVARESDADMIAELQRLDSEGTLSPALHLAVTESITAIESGNYELAADLTGVKSFITGKMFDGDDSESRGLRKRNHFREDKAANEAALNDTAYGILDGIHHELAFSLHQMPRGMVTVSAAGIESREEAYPIHPVLKMMQEEHDRIVDEANRRYQRG